MNVKWEQKDGATVARIEGRIDSANIPVFQRALESSLDPDANPDYSWRPRLGHRQAVTEPDSVTDSG